MTGTQNIVILGGGYAGAVAARELEKRTANDPSYRVLLVEKKEFFYHAVAAPRAMVEPVENLIPYTGLLKLKKNQIVQASAVKLESHRIHLDTEFEGSFEIPFAFSIIATGTSNPDPWKLSTTGFDESNKHLAKLRQQVKEARAIVIVGGGPVGIELAGEIREVYADKKITIVHRGDQLLSDDFAAKPRKRLLEKVQRNNINVIFGDSVAAAAGHDNAAAGVQVPATAPIIQTANGKTLDCDLLLVAFGNSPNTSWLDPSLLANNGYVKVKPSLQVDAPGFDTVYAMGDVADLQEVKMAAKVAGHVNVVIANITAAIKGRTSSKPASVYTGSPTGAAITLGKKQGLLITPLGSLGDWATSTLKGKSLFTERYWKELGAQYPTRTSDSHDKRPSWLFWVVGAGLIALSAVYLAQSSSSSLSLLPSIQQSVITISNRFLS